MSKSCPCVEELSVCRRKLHDNYRSVREDRERGNESNIYNFFEPMFYVESL